MSAIRTGLPSMRAHAIDLLTYPAPYASESVEVGPWAVQPTWARRQGRARNLTAFVILLVASAAAVALGRITRLDATTSSAAEVTIASGSALAGSALAWFVALRVRRTSEYRTVGHGRELDRVVVATLASFGLLTVVNAFVPIDGARFDLLTALPMGLLLLVVGRAFWQRRLDTDRAVGLSLTRALIVGFAADIDFVAEQLGRAAARKHVVVSVVFSYGLPEFNAVTSTGFPAFDEIEAMTDAIAISNADVVILASHPGDGGEFVRTLSWRLESSTAELILAWCLDSVDASRLRFDAASGMPMTHIATTTSSGGKHRGKGAMDVVLSGFALLVLAPVFGVIALLIRRDSAGPVFFRQECVGVDANRFLMIKFRSMVTTAEAVLAGLTEQNDGNGILFKLHADPRDLAALLARRAAADLEHFRGRHEQRRRSTSVPRTRGGAVGRSRSALSPHQARSDGRLAGRWAIRPQLGGERQARSTLRRELVGPRRYPNHLAHRQCRRQARGVVLTRCSEPQRSRGWSSSPSGYWRARCSASVLASFRVRNPECGSTQAADAGQEWGIW